MINALWITVIGMGLVFVAILLLWGMMALLVRLTETRAVPEKAAEGIEEVSKNNPALADTVTDDDRRRRAAAAAVVVALALRERKAVQVQFPESAQTERSWQVVQRANELSRRGALKVKP